MRILLAIVAVCSHVSPLFAESITNQELLKACKDSSAASQNFCYGFIISAANAAQFYRNIVDTEGEYIDICFPETISNKDIVDLYISWAEKNTTTANESAFVGVSSSFSTEYSCSDKSPAPSKVMLSPVSTIVPSSKPSPLPPTSSP